LGVNATVICIDIRNLIRR